MKGVVRIKHFHSIFNPWLQTINVSVSSDSKSLLIFDGFLLHLNIDILKKLGGMVCWSCSAWQTPHTISMWRICLILVSHRHDFKMMNKVSWQSVSFFVILTVSIDNTLLVSWSSNWRRLAQLFSINQGGKILECTLLTMMHSNTYVR